METKYYVDALGNYLGGYAGAEPPVGAIEVPTAPDRASDIWNGTWVKTAQQRRDEIDTQIIKLEKEQLLSRITRESLLAMAVDKAAALGMTEPQLYATHAGYHKLKDFDTAIAALRDQRDAIV